MYIPVKVSLSALFVNAIIIAILLSGFFTNFLSFSQVNAGTVLIDFILSLLLLHLLLLYAYSMYNKVRVDKVYYSILGGVSILLLLTLGKLIFLDRNPLSEKLLGLRNNLIYITPLLYIPFFFKKQKHVIKTLNLLLALGLFLVLFSYFQSVFSTVLPTSLMVLRSEGTFGFWGSTIIRPTALVGNTIIFSSFTIILFSFYLAKYLYSHSKKTLFILLFIAVATILTFTRAALVGLVLVILVGLYIRYGRLSISFILKVFSIVLLICTISIGAFFAFKDTLIIKRFTGQDINSMQSNNEHFSQINAAVSYLNQHPLAGAGIGSQGPSGGVNKIITDGYWFHLYLENGIILGTLYLFFYLSCFTFAFREFNRTHSVFQKQLCMAFICSSTYFGAASFLNSAFAGRTNFIIYWVLFGLLVSGHLIEKKKLYGYSGN